MYSNYGENLQDIKEVFALLVEQIYRMGLQKSKKDSF